MGATFIAGPGSDELVFYHAQESYADHPDPKFLLEKAKEGLDDSTSKKEEAKKDKNKKKKKSKKKKEGENKEEAKDSDVASEDEEKEK